MKRIIIISDSHDSKNKIEEIIATEKYDYLFFLGDGIKDIEEKDQENILKVSGNCDIFSTEAKERVVVIENLRFLLTHGHIYKVKWGLGAIINEATKRKMDVVCYGHTHTKDVQTIDGITYINPGSLFAGRYMIIEVHDGKILNIITKG